MVLPSFPLLLITLGGSLLKVPVCWVGYIVVLQVIKWLYSRFGVRPNILLRVGQISCCTSLFKKKKMYLSHVLNGANVFGCEIDSLMINHYDF